MQRNPNVGKDAEPVAGFSPGQKTAFLGCMLMIITLTPFSLADQAVLRPNLPEIPYDRKFDAFLHKEIGQVEGLMVERKIMIDPFVDQQIVFFVGGELSAPTLKIRNPNGQRVDDDDAQVKRHAMKELNAYLVSKPETGEWQITLQPDADIQEQSYVFAVTGRGRSNVQLDINAKSEPIQSGTPLVLTCTPYGPFAGVSGVSITGIVTSPSGQAETVVFRDDGLAEHQDEHEGDGIYTAILRNTQEAGDYVAAVRALNQKGKSVVGFDTGPPGSARAVPIPAFQRFGEIQFRVGTTQD